MNWTRGWLGRSAFFTPAYLVGNAMQRRKLARLPYPASDRRSVRMKGVPPWVFSVGASLIFLSAPILLLLSEGRRTELLLAASGAAVLAAIVFTWGQKRLLK